MGRRGRKQMREKRSETEKQQRHALLVGMRVYQKLLGFSCCSMRTVKKLLCSIALAQLAVSEQRRERQGWKMLAVGPCERM
eukprot:611945-Hanusia_phi.AAC.2